MEKKKKFVNFKEFNERAALKQKMDDFMEKSVRCSHFEWKKEDARTQTAWCKVLQCGCKYHKCPKIK